MLADAGLDGGPDVSDADSGSDASLGPGRDAQVASDSDADVMEAGTLPDQDAGGASDANPGADDGDAEPDSDAMAPYTFKVDSKDVWSASNFQVTQDSCYLVTATIDDQWLDLDVVSNLNGWIDKSNPLYGLFVALRRVPQDDIAFYQFAACVDRDTKACFAIGDAATICPKKSGELFFFVNDVPGFESNNVGTATVRIAKKP